MVAHLPLPNAISELFAQVTLSRQLTLADRYGIMAVLCDESVSEEDLQALDRILYALRKGSVRVVDDLSAICK